MSVVTSTRLRQSNIIAQNPASIVITRTAKISDGAGGWTTLDPETLASQGIRIYSKRTRTLVIDEGGYHTVRITKGRALWNADVQKYSSDNEDKFTFGSKNYRVYDVIDRYIGGSICFKELELEEV